MKVINVAIEEKEVKRKVFVKDLYITFISEDIVTLKTFLNLNYNGRNHVFNVTDISTEGKFIKAKAVEKGYFARTLLTLFKDAKSDPYKDLRSLIGIKLNIITDESVIKKAKEANLWT